MGKFAKVVLIAIAFLMVVGLGAGIWNLERQIVELKRDFQVSEGQFRKLLADLDDRFSKLSSENREMAQKMESFVTITNFEQGLNQKTLEILRMVADGLHTKLSRGDFETFQAELFNELSLMAVQLQRNDKDLESLKVVQEMLWDLTDGHYDRFAFARPQDIDGIKNSLVRLEVQGVFQRKASSDGEAEVLINYTQQWLGIGVAISPNKVLTLWHIYDSTPFGWSPVSRKILVGGKEATIALQDPKKDLLIISAPDDVVFTPISIPLGKPNELKDGDMVWIFGFPWGEEIMIRPGFAASVNPQNSKAIEVFLKSVAPARPIASVFIVNLQAVAGDSGGLAIAFRDGKPELAGIAEAAFGPFAIIASIDYFVPEIKIFQ